MSDNQKTSTSHPKTPAPSAKLAARRRRQAEALRENLAKRKRQRRGDAPGTSGPPDPGPPPSGPPATGQG